MLIDVLNPPEAKGLAVAEIMIEVVSKPHLIRLRRIFLWT
jgi:hypothetical protein